MCSSSRTAGTSASAGPFSRASRRGRRRGALTASPSRSRRRTGGAASSTRIWASARSRSTRCSSSRVIRALVALSVVLCDDALRCGEGGVGGRDPAVDGSVQEDFFYLVLAQAVPERSPHVHLQLLEPAEGHQRGQGDAASRPAVQPRAAPDLAPRVARYEVLEVRGEAGRALECRVDVFISQHLAPHLHATLVSRVVRAHLPCPARWSSIARVTASGCSMFARWEAPGITSKPAPGMESRMSSPCSGGVAGSSAAEMTRVGALICPSLSLRSMSRIAAQHPA